MQQALHVLTVCLLMFCAFSTVQTSFSVSFKLAFIWVFLSNKAIINFVIYKRSLILIVIGSKNFNYSTSKHVTLINFKTSPQNQSQNAKSQILQANKMKQLSGLSAVTASQPADCGQYLLTADKDVHFLYDKQMVTFHIT